MSAIGSRAAARESASGTVANPIRKATIPALPCRHFPDAPSHGVTLDEVSLPPSRKKQHQGFLLGVFPLQPLPQHLDPLLQRGAHA